MVQIYSLDCGELLYVQNILTVHCPRLGEGKEHERDGVERKNRTQVYLNRSFIITEFHLLLFKRHKFPAAAMLDYFGWRGDLKKEFQSSEIDSSTHCVRSCKLLTSGTKGGSTIPASSLLKLMFLKNEWALTPAAPSARHPSLCFGSLVSSWVCSSRDESPNYSSVHPPLHANISPHRCSPFYRWPWCPL